MKKIVAYILNNLMLTSVVLSMGLIVAAYVFEPTPAVIAQSSCSHTVFLSDEYDKGRSPSCTGDVSCGGGWCSCDICTGDSGGGGGGGGTGGGDGGDTNPCTDLLDSTECICPVDTSTTESCPVGETGSIITDTHYSKNNACMPEVSVISSCTPETSSPSTISVTSNTTGAWSISPGNASGSGSGSVQVTPSPVGTIYTITPGVVSGYLYPPTISNTVTGFGSSMALFGGEEAGFTLTYAVDPNGPFGFNYSLDRTSSSVSVSKSSGNVFVQNTIIKNLLSGLGQSVNLSIEEDIPGVSYSIAGRDCAPNCQSTITFTISPSAPTGTQMIHVRGTPLDKTTQFNLVINNSDTVAVTCTPSSPVVKVGQIVTWTANATGGTPPYTYSWSGTNVPSPAPTSNPFSTSYSTVGSKSLRATVTDSNGVKGSCTEATVQVGLNPKFEEF
ncbi:hypothetical protein KW790_01170 [Candidatus Parcubacteria bacterium]|nr:hypothetical protein [Candidatus Parcubacteria bacterium]